jgi:hypothetical protein
MRPSAAAPPRPGRGPTQTLVDSRLSGGLTALHAVLHDAVRWGEMVVGMTSAVVDTDLDLSVGSTLGLTSLVSAILVAPSRLDLLAWVAVAPCLVPALAIDLISGLLIDRRRMEDAAGADLRRLKGASRAASVRSSDRLSRSAILGESRQVWWTGTPPISSRGRPSVWWTRPGSMPLTGALPITGGPSMIAPRPSRISATTATCTHLDRRAGDLALGVVHLADKEAAAIDEAGQQQRRADLHPLHVHVAAVLARRDGAQALALVPAVAAAEDARQRRPAAAAARCRRRHRAPPRGRARPRPRPRPASVPIEPVKAS